MPDIPTDGSQPLKGRQETFAQLYSIGDISATQAYLKAGYSKNGADGHASRLVGKGITKARIAYIKAEWAKDAKVTREGQSKKLALVASKCLDNGEHSTYVRAVEAQNRLYGLDKQVIETKTDKPLTRTEQQEADEWADYQLWREQHGRQGTNALEATDGGNEVYESTGDGIGCVVAIRETA